MPTGSLLVMSRNDKRGYEVGELLGINPATLRNWIRRDLGEAGRSADGS